MQQLLNMVHSKREQLLENRRSHQDEEERPSGSVRSASFRSSSEAGVEAEEDAEAGAAESENGDVVQEEAINIESKKEQEELKERAEEESKPDDKEFLKQSEDCTIM